MNCPKCGSPTKIVKGWESAKAIQCPKCGEYCYFVGGAVCIKTVHFEDSGGWDFKKAREILSADPK